MKRHNELKETKEMAQRDRQNSSIRLRSEIEKKQAQEVRPLETKNLRQRRLNHRLRLLGEGASKGSAPPATKGMTSGDHQLVSAPPMTKGLDSTLGYNEAKAQPSVANDHRRPSACLGLHSIGASESSASPTTEEFRSDPFRYLRRRHLKHRLRLLGEGASKVSEPPMTEQVDWDRPLGNDEAKAQPTVANDHRQLLAGDETSRESDPSPGSLDSLLHQYDKSTRFKHRLRLLGEGASKGSAPPTTKGMTIGDHQSASAPPMTNEVRSDSPLGYDEAKAQPSMADNHRRPSAGEKTPLGEYASPRQSTTQVGCEFDDNSNEEKTAMAGGAECPCAPNYHWQLLASGGETTQGEESHPSPPISIDPLPHQYMQGGGGELDDGNNMEKAAVEEDHFQNLIRRIRAKVDVSYDDPLPHQYVQGSGELDDGNNMEKAAVEEDHFHNLIRRIRAKVDVSYDDSIDDTVYPVHGYLPPGKEKKTTRTRRISQQSYDTGLICIEIAPFFKNLFGKDELTEDASSEKKAVDVENCSAWEAKCGDIVPSLFAEDLFILDQQFEGTLSPEESILIESIEAEANFGNSQASSGKHNSSSRNSTSCEVVLSSPVSVIAPLETWSCA
jgi:hypothetical protein